TMTEFLSERTTVNAPPETVYQFLGNFNNFEHLMPPQIKNWKSDEDHCSFTIEGLADLSMRIASKKENKSVFIVAEGKNPIDYTLDCFIFPMANDQSDVEIAFRAELNPFVKSVASRPLQNFVNMLSQKLQEHFA
ncbi:MAG: SRPBCC family protein, partial [Bacteroidota bacterium]